MKCPSLMNRVCLRCLEVYDRIDGRGVFDGTTTDSHGYCQPCLPIVYREAGLTLIEEE